MAKIPEYIHDVFLTPAHRSAKKQLLFNRHTFRPTFLHRFCILTKNFSDSSQKNTGGERRAKPDGTAYRRAVRYLFLHAPIASLSTREALKHFVCFKAHEKSEVPF